MSEELNRLKHPFWALPVSEVASILHTDTERGLPEKDAKQRLRTYGTNVIERTHRLSRLVIFLDQFKSPLAIILLLASVVTLFMGHYRDAGFILAAVLVNAILGFYQEFKAEKALTELTTYLKHRSRVIRDGKEYEIDSSEIVPGDSLRLTQGDRVPADARVFYANDFQVDEAILTGESLPVAKSAHPSSASAGLADQHSMVFAGTLVTQGVVTAIVCRTGFETELGQIAALVSDARREETPLQKKIRLFSLRLGAFLGVLTLLVFATGIMLGHSYVDMFLISVAVAVGAVPEGLPIALTVILAVGVERMARRKGVVRKLVAAETLGSTTIILTDKTGTLTQANMSLSKIISTGTLEADAILNLALINTNVLIENPHEPPAEWRMSGKVIEIALVKSAALRGIPAAAIKQKFSIANALPFNAVNKFSVSLIKEGGVSRLVFLGAPDVLLPHSTLFSMRQKELLRQIGALARSGELVLGIATKVVTASSAFSFAKDLKLDGLTLEGILTLHDPVRPAAADALRRVHDAGIKTMLLTGDHRGTAEAIAKEVGIELESENVLDAEELRLLSDEVLMERLPKLRLISRVSPFDKSRIVKVLQAQGEVVAMTGDGVNDAPSIKQADVGIAMGSGTAVARDVADLVLLDDNFETIAAAVEEGRQITRDIQKVLVYFLSSITNELMLIGGALLAGLALPLTALQILWVNFFSDSFPAVAFAFEKNIDGFAPGIPGNKRTLFTPVMRFLILFIGLSTSALLFVLYWFLLRAGFAPDIVRTFIFASFGTYTLFLALSLRSLEKSIFSYPFASNPYLLGGVGTGLVLTLAAVYVPFFQTLLDTVPLPPLWLLGVIFVGLFNILAVEFGKWVFRRNIPSF